MNNCVIIATAKNEELYLDEWVEYHLNLGFNHIYICDNNEIPCKYKHNKVTIHSVNDIDFSKNIYEGLIESYNRVIKTIKCDYCCVIDVDEFVQFKNCNTVQEFIEKYVDDIAEIPWEIYDDNDLIFHINKPVLELYTNIQNKIEWDWLKNECSWSKSIFKMQDNINITPHRPKNYKKNLISKDIAVIKHYRTKCLEDYIKEKCLQRNADKALFTKGNIILTYFNFNNITLDKLLWVLRFVKDCNYQISSSDRQWLLHQFELFNPITIVIRTYNRLKCLKHCVKLLNKQSYKSKILVLNDGSNDNTDKWLSKLPFDYLTLRDNVGPGEILARGKYLITTPYYIILDDDDEWINTHTIEFFYNSIIDNPYLDIVLCDKHYHAVCLTNTKLLLDCPNLSLYTKDDYYYIWIRNHAKNIINAKFSFYNYRAKLDLDYHVNNKISEIATVAYSFYKELNLNLMTSYINNNYHRYKLWERKVADQMIKYLSLWVG